MNEKELPQGFVNIFDYVKKNVDFSEFLETDIACTLKWYEPEVSAGCICPFPDHPEKAGSFRLKRVEDGAWIYHCFGCGRKGTIIDFFQQYYNLDNVGAAIRHLCKKFGFEELANAEYMPLAVVEKRFNIRKKTECAHVEVASQCRRLLTKDYKRHSKWVASTFKRLNTALDTDDLDTIEKIGFEACNKIGER